MLAVESADGKSFDLISGSRHALHFHASLSPYEKNAGIGALGLDSIGNGDGREDVASRAATTDDDSQFLIHNSFYSLVAKVIIFFIISTI